ncbi:MAG TPA: hypothetical protein PK530_03590 [Anaerolineales bacterium]|nr:hypothetical protein [Anaerolineales bacterium]
MKTYPRKFLFLPLALAGVLLGAFLVSTGGIQTADAYAQGTLLVTNTNNSGPGSLRQAINLANTTPGPDAIVADMPDCTLATPCIIPLTAELPTITETVIITGTGANSLILDAGGLFRVFNIADVNVTIADLTIRNGHAPGNGGGVRTMGELILTRVYLLDNIALGAGGGVYSEDGVKIVDGWVEGNESGENGGGIYTEGNVYLENTPIIDNTADWSGGGVYALQELYVVGGSVVQNASVGNGGGLYASYIGILGAEITSNTAGDSGGGIYAEDVNLLNTTVLSNTANSVGGGLYGNTVIVTGGMFQGNHSAYGGGLFSYINLTLTDVYLSQNHASEYGGGVYGVRFIYISGCHFDQNVSDFNGGAVAGTPNSEGVGEAEIVDSLFTENSALGAGGAMLFDSTFGVFSYAMIIESSAFLDNSASVGGGVYYNLDVGQIVNSLFAGNTATTDGSALGLFSNDAITILHTTIVGDEQNPVSGIRLLNSELSIYNTIFTQHETAILNVSGTLEQNYNLFFQNTTNISGTFSGGSNTVLDDPHFIAPQQHDYHLGAGSAALDAGLGMGVNVDFDGDPVRSGPGLTSGMTNPTRFPV